MIPSALAFNDSISSFRSQISLTETEESWDKISRSILAFTELVRSSGALFPQETIAAVRELHRPINSALKSERTRLSGPAIDLISAIAAELGTAFDSLLPLFFPTLLQLCARTSKVVINRSRACILSIIESTQLVSVLPYFLQSIKDKSTTVRVVVVEGTLACVNCSNPPDLEKEARTKEIEALIKATIRDANADVRKMGKQVFHAYEELLPRKAESFAAPLTPTSKKYLGLTTRPKSAMGQTAAPPRPVNNLSRSTSASVACAPPREPQLRKKPSQKLGAPPTATASTSSSSVLPLAPPPNKLSLAPSSSAGSQSQPTSQLGFTSDSGPASSTPLGDDALQQQSTGYVLVRPVLPSSRSESTVATGKHFRSASAVTSATSGPVRNAKPLSRSTSGAPVRIPVSSSTTDSSSAPDCVVASKPTVGPVRIDPSAGRERIHTGPRKPELPKLSTEGPTVSVIRPPPKANKEESEVDKSRKERQVPKKPALPKLTGTGTGRKEETVKRPEVPRLLRKEPQQPAPVTKKPSMKTLKHATDTQDTTEAGTEIKGGRAQAGTSGSANAGTKSASSSTSGPAAEKSQAVMPRARTVSTSSAATKAPVARVRTISASTSTQAAKPPAARTHTLSATSTGAGVAKSASTKTTTTKSAWGGSSASTRPVASVRRSKGKGKEPATKLTRSTGNTRKQKRPSVVSEEVEGVGMPDDSESEAEVVGERAAEESTDGGGSLEPEDVGAETRQKKELVEQKQDKVAATSGLESKEEAPTTVPLRTNTSPGPTEKVAASEQVNEEAPISEFSAVLETTESSLQKVPGTSAPDASNPASNAVTNQVDPTQSDVTLAAVHVQSEKENEDATPVAKVSVAPLGVVQTPVRKNPSGLSLELLTTTDGENTPITALLTSIQQGFLFSPVTPMSPAESYLPKGLRGTGGTSIVAAENASIPFPLFSSKAPETAHAAEIVGSGSDGTPKPFELPSRQALGTMKMN